MSMPHKERARGPSGPLTEVSGETGRLLDVIACVHQALAPGSETKLDAETLEAAAGSAPSAELPYDQVCATPHQLPEVGVKTPFSKCDLLKISGGSVWVCPHAGGRLRAGGCDGGGEAAGQQGGRQAPHQGAHVLRMHACMHACSSLGCLLTLLAYLCTPAVVGACMLRWGRVSAGWGRAGEQ